MNLYSSGQYKANHPAWHNEDAPWKAEEIIKILKKNHLSPISVLDIGCGTGSVLRILKKEFKLQNACGFEPFDEIIKIAKSKNSDLKFTKLLPSKQFDLIILIDVLEHLERPEKLLKQIKNLSKFKIFHIPLALSVQAKIRKKPLHFGRTYSGHLHNFTKETALDFLQKNHFNIIDYHLTKGSILSPHKTNKQKFLNFFRVIFFPFFPNLTSRIFGGFSLIVLAK